MKQYRIIPDISEAEWRDFTAQHANGNIFQTPQMKMVYNATLRVETKMLALIDEKRCLHGVLLILVQDEGRALIGRLTKRSVILGGPLISSEAGLNGLELFLRGLDEISGRTSIYAQIRNFWDCQSQRRIFEKNHFTYTEHLNYILDLSVGEKVLWNNLTDSRKNGIRRARNHNLTVRLAANMHDIKESYAILSQVYRRVRIPLVDRSLFEAAYKILLHNNEIKIFLAIRQNVIIGVLYLLVYKTSLYVWYAGSRSQYYKICPNDMLYWEAIAWGVRNEYKVFDFGGAGVPGVEYGVRQFKKEFGGYPTNYGRFTKVYNPTVKKVIDLYSKYIIKK